MRAGCMGNLISRLKRAGCWRYFDGGDNSLNVSVVPRGLTRPKVPLISMHFDLSGVFEEFMYGFFLDSIGLLSNTHNILAWSFRMNGLAHDLDLSNLPTVLESKSTHKLRFAIGASIVAMVVMIVAIFTGLHFFKRLRDAEVVEDRELEYGPHKFSYKELRIATKGFRERGLLGKGGFRGIYKGVLPSNVLEVVVKRVSYDSK